MSKKNKNKHNQQNNQQTQNRHNTSKQPSMSLELRDLNAKKTKVSGELDRLKNEIKNLEDRIEALKKEKEQAGKEKPEDKKGSSLAIMHNNRKQASTSDSSTTKLIVPSLPKLPETGKFYQLNGNVNYLAIEFWEDYDTGKQEAARLNAKLCAKGE